MRNTFGLFLAFVCFNLAVAKCSAQDTRTVVEPTIPPACTVLNAQQAIVSGAPASETVLDTARVQSALNACASGKAVELAPSADGSNYAFILGSINIPSGVGLIVDGGVTAFASRNPADYQVTGAEDCGTYGSGNGCKNLIAFANGAASTGSGVYGYGVIDGRGYATMLRNGVDSGISWWTNADLAHGAGKGQDNPVLLGANSPANLTLYKVTFRDSPMFHIGSSGSNGFTIWGVKVMAPWTTHNTDGIDPQGANMTIAYTSISDGDDDIAVGASHGSSNVTIDHVTTYSGHGISVGSYTGAGLSNMLVQNVNMAGTKEDSNATGLRLKSAADRGGLVKNVTYQNICIRDTKYAIAFDPFYNTNAGTSIPTYQNITLRNVHALTPSPTANAYRVQLQGYDVNHPTTLTMDNVVFDQLLAANVTPTPQYTSITLLNNVYPSLLQSLAGPGVSYNGSATATTAGAYNCSATSTIFPYIVGELFLSTGTTTNLQSTSVPNGTSVTLNAMLEPATSQASFSGTTGKYTGAAAPSKPVNFYEGTTLVGSASLGANGTLAPLVLSHITPGAHTYTAQYPGDSNYAALTFGSVSVTVAAAATTTTLSVPAQATYGTKVSLSASVAGPGGTPTGQVTFYDGTTLLATVNLAAGAASVGIDLNGGQHSLSAVYSGDAGFVNSTSATAPLTVAAAATSVALSAPATAYPGSSVVLTASVVPAVPGLTVQFLSGATSLGSGITDAAGMASYSWTAGPVGVYALSASVVATGNYGGSSSAAKSLSVVNAVALNATPGTLSLAPGATGTVTLTVTGQAGFNGNASATCQSPATYITCSLASSTLPVSGTAAFVASIHISSTLNSAGIPGSERRCLWACLISPMLLGLGFARRKGKKLRPLRLLGMTVAGCLFIGGCGGSSSSVVLPPAGAQTLTFSVVAAGVSQSTSFQINVQR